MEEFAFHDVDFVFKSGVDDELKGRVVCVCDEALKMAENPITAVEHEGIFGGELWGMEIFRIFGVLNEGGDDVFWG